VLSAKPRHTLRAGAFFAVKWSFFWGGARAGRMTALAYQYIRGGVNGACGMNTTTPTACVGQKTERNCKKRDSPICLTSLSNDAIIKKSRTPNKQ
jgi:hypothetical protein